MLGTETTFRFCPLPAAELHQLHHGAIVLDHGYTEAVRRTRNTSKKRESLDRLFEFVHDKSNVRDLPDKLVDFAVCIEAHPLYSERARVEPAYMNLQMRYITLVRMRNVSGDAYMVITPTESGRNAGKFVIET
jgi:hypothetical protein